jgi:hypothetical protein
MNGFTRLGSSRLLVRHILDFVLAGTGATGNDKMELRALDNCDITRPSRHCG